jgi:hypothetical protein
MGTRLLAELAELPPQGRGYLRNLLSQACNLMHYLAHLFSVRSCWHRCQHCQLEGWVVGGARVG